MNDLISRQAAIDAMSHICDSICEGQAIDALSELPTIDPVKHGRWKIEREPSGVRLMVCDCGYRFPAVLGLYHFKYCPNCGAKMD